MEYNEEVWRDINGYGGVYQVSDCGRVRSLKFNKVRMMRLQMASRGYLQVVLCSGGKPRYHYVHRLVAEAFVENPKGYVEVVHANGDNLDNRSDNLKWSSSTERYYGHNGKNRKRK